MEIKKFLYFICSLLQVVIAIGIVVGYTILLFYATIYGIEYNIFYYVLLGWAIMGWISLIKNISFLLLSMATGEELPTGWWDFFKKLVQATEYDKMLPVQILIVLIAGGSVLALSCYLGVEEPLLLVKAVSRGIGIVLFVYSIIFSKFWRRLYLAVAILIVAAMGVVLLPGLVGVRVIRWLQKKKQEWFTTINYK